MLRSYRALVGNAMCIQSFGRKCYVHTELSQEMLRAYRALVGNVTFIQSFGRKCYVHTELW